MHGGYKLYRVVMYVPVMNVDKFHRKSGDDNLMSSSYIRVLCCRQTQSGCAVLYLMIKAGI